MAKIPAKTHQESDAPEVFADGVASVAIRRNIARITMISERVSVDDAEQTDRVVVGHVAMSLAGFLDLHARMLNIVDQMKDRGAVVPKASSKVVAKKPAKQAAKPKRAAARKKT